MKSPRELIKCKACPTEHNRRSEYCSRKCFQKSYQTAYRQRQNKPTRDLWSSNMKWKQKGSWKIDSAQTQEVARWLRHSISINRIKTMIQLMSSITNFQKLVTGKTTWLDEAHASIIALAIDEQAITRYNRKAVSMGWPLGGINRSYHTHAIGATMCEMMERGDMAPFNVDIPNEATAQAIKELEAGTGERFEIEDL